MFSHEFEVVATQTECQLLRTVQRVGAGVVVLCFCSAEEGQVRDLVRLDALTGPVPVLACTKTHNPNFVRLAAQQGVDHFLLCDMDVDKIRQTVFTAIRTSGMRSFLEFCCPGGLTSSPYVNRMVNEIVTAFPRRLTTSELSRQLGLSPRRVQMICREAFGKPFTRLMRRIWVYHALKLMSNTSLDNTEIALQLDYSDASSLARIFRKELGCSPNDARKLLANSSPREVLS